MAEIRELSLTSNGARTYLSGEPARPSRTAQRSPEPVRAVRSFAWRTTVPPLTPRILACVYSAPKSLPLSDEIVRSLVDSKDIECASKKEVVLDVESVFANFVRLDKEAADKAKELLTARGLPHTEFSTTQKTRG